VQCYNSLHALMLARRYDFGRHRRVLDLAGLSPDFLAQAAIRNPELRGTFATGGPLLNAARLSVAAAARDRIEFVEADPLADNLPNLLPEPFDAILLEHVIHRFDAEANRTILAAARRVAAPGARLLLLDFLLDPADGRRLDPLLAGEYLVVDGTVVYPEAEVRDWLVATGWRPVDALELPGSPRVLIADAP
jgi:SAM-dependent methyltransferase